MERFILDPSLGEFIHIGAGSLHMPDKGGKTVYSCTPAKINIFQIKKSAARLFSLHFGCSWLFSAGNLQMFLAGNSFFRGNNCTGNEGNYGKWDSVMQSAVQNFKEPTDGSKPYSLR